MSITSSIMMPKDVDVRRILYGQPKQQNNGSRMIYISYEDNGRGMLVQTPAMKAPFGIKLWASDNGGPDKYNLDVSFDGRDSRPNVDQFYKMLEEMDKRVVADAVDNTMAWFKKKHPTPETYGALYTHMVKHPRDKVTGEISTQFSPTFKMSLPMRDGKFRFPVYNAKREQIDLFDIINSDTHGKGSSVQAIVMCSGVWVVGTKFGVSWKVQQLRICEPARITGYAFRNDGEADAGEEEEEEVEAAPAARARARPAAAAAAASQFIASSDEEDEPLDGGAGEEDDLEPRRAPAPRASSSSAAR